MADKVILYDTTLRDGAQTEGVSFSTEDKLEILQRLDEFGIDFVEGGWPSSNPKDDLFFARAKEIKLKNTRLVAFGSTRRAKSSADRDAGLASLIAAGTEWICIFGKTWDLHVEKALQVSLEENLRIVELRFDAAAASATEVLDAVARRTRAEAERANAYYGYLQAIAAYEHGLGEILDHLREAPSS